MQSNNYRCAVGVMCLLAAWSMPVIAEPVAPAIRVTLLGTGAPPVRPYRSGPSTLVEVGDQILVFDAGRGTTTQLTKAGIAFPRVDKLFLTHLHSDHITGIPDLLLTGWLMGRRDNPLRVWGPEGTESLMTNLGSAFEYDIWLRSNLYKMNAGFPPLSTAGVMADVTEITEGVVYRTDGITVTVFDVDHSPIEPAFGYRVDYKGHSVVISGDTVYSENLVEYAQGADVLVHEVAYGTPEEMRIPFRRAVVGYHTSPADAARVFEEVRPKLAVFTHVITNDPANDAAIVPAVTQDYSGEVVLGQDLMVIEIGDEVTVSGDMVEHN
jgi:ribonuclease Z